jgi:hypothetical protein
MGITCRLELAAFFRVVRLLACMQAEASPTGLSKHDGIAGCVHQTGDFRRTWTA